MKVTNLNRSKSTKIIHLLEIIVKSHRLILKNSKDVKMFLFFS